MKILSALLAVLLVASTAIARGPTQVKINKSGTKATYYRDDDRDGHYAKKGEVDLRRRGYYGGSRYYSGNRYYGNRYGSGYYGNRYYGSSRYYGGRYYTGYRRPYYSSYSIWPWRSRTIAVSVRPSYSSNDYGYSSLEANVQRALRREGYYSGPVDGDIGPGSRSAIRAYQDDNGLRVTGRIDSALIRSLNI